MQLRHSRQRSITRAWLVLVACCIVLMQAESPGSQERAAQIEGRGPLGLGGMRLLPGYQHQFIRGIDTCNGRIWKEGGADIDYDIGSLAGNHARAKSQGPTLAWFKVQQVGNSSFEVAMGTDKSLTVTVGGVANFRLRGAGDEIVADVLLMLMTYNSERHMLDGCL